MNIEQVKARVVAAVLASLIILVTVALWQAATSGWLIQALHGVVDKELQKVADRVEYVNDRFGNLELMITDTPHGCGNPTPSACPQGWTDMDIRFQNTYPGGDCGLGTQYRLCIRVAE